MNLQKFLSGVIFITFFCLLYVYQQSEIFRLAYVGEKEASVFQDLLDKNTYLRYNIQSNVSVIRLGNKISESKDYEMPSTFELVRLSNPLENIKVARQAPRRENVIARFFSVKREAQAKTVSP